MVRNILVGYTGFVGSNLNDENHFDLVFNSKNIEEAYGINPELLVYSGVPAQKFLANSNPEADKKVIDNAIENIKKINPKEIVLISTIDVYKDPNNKNEDSVIDTNDLHAYGYNRYLLENWVIENFENYLIVRLPGLYGKNIKKNFIYDLINVVPQMLKEEKFIELISKKSILEKYYDKQDNGFYKLKEVTKDEKEFLKSIFEELNFTALNFTDSRAKFQFYNLNYLWHHIQLARKNNIKLLNLATEPVSIKELYKFIKGEEFNNELVGSIPNYNFKTKHSKIFNGNNGYIFDKEFILNDVKKFVKEYKI